MGPSAQVSAARPIWGANKPVNYSSLARGAGQGCGRRSEVVLECWLLSLNVVRTLTLGQGKSRPLVHGSQPASQPASSNIHQTELLKLELELERQTLLASAGIHYTVLDLARGSVC